MEEVPSELSSLAPALRHWRLATFQGLMGLCGTACSGPCAEMNEWPKLGSGRAA